MLLVIFLGLAGVVVLVTHLVARRRPRAPEELRARRDWTEETKRLRRKERR